MSCCPTSPSNQLNVDFPLVKVLAFTWDQFLNDYPIYSSEFDNDNFLIIDTPLRDQLTPLPLSAAYMHQWIGYAMVQIMARRLFGAELLSEQTLGYCQLDP